MRASSVEALPLSCRSANRETEQLLVLPGSPILCEKVMSSLAAVTMLCRPCPFTAEFCPGLYLMEMPQGSPGFPMVGRGAVSREHSRQEPTMTTEKLGEEKT